MAVPFITKDNASALGRKGAIATAEKWKQAQNIYRLAPMAVLSNAVPLDSYVQQRLTRVRKQIELLSKLMEAETNPQAIDRYSASIDRLSKLEGYYANRPGPGNRKPAPDRPSKQSRRDLGATELAPQPQPEAYKPSPVHDPNEPNG